MNSTKHRVLTVSLLLLLSLSAAATTQAADPPAAKNKVLFIGIDGCRADAMHAANAPALHALRDGGAYSEIAQTGDITVSGPGWSSMLTGVWREKHGVRDNTFTGKNLTEYPSFLDRFKAAHPDARTASFATWAPIHQNIIAKADVKTTFKKDADAADAAVKELQTADPDAVFLDLDDVDHAGHAHGFSTKVPQYMTAIETADAQVGRAVTAMRGRPAFARENWLVLVTTDHGGSGKSHGKNIPEHRTIFVIANGPAVAPGEIKPAPGIVDVAATALAHLGVPVQPDWKLDGKAIGLRTTGLK
ncbi:alkaline phosphatase family protein [Fimbriiglobus ruber]|uniref:Putative nucleotide pyrophosphatase n=1 Tax=Fimbriiglobus ruber TaxID=1908690 RepID=A0A225EES2_9BACT|nr:alkaline phosphatase family protein [Fimbriiglobus ruber]OWK46777.1 putative nucleotide pyrophosphatase [Fimbriiglobus ruber]